MHVLVPTEERDRVMGSFLRGSRMGRRKLRRRSTRMEMGERWRESKGMERERRRRRKGV